MDFEWKIELLEEFEDIIYKISRLDKYLFEEDNQDELLEKQYHAMIDYSNCLRTRIEKLMGCDVK